MSYQAISRAEPNEQIITGLTHHLDSNEIPLVGARSLRFQFRLDTIKFATLLVTNRRLIVTKDKLFGKPKPAVTIKLTELRSSGFGPLYGVGPTWEVRFHTLSNEPGIMYFSGPIEAEAFQKALLDVARTSVHGDAMSSSPEPSPNNDPAFQGRLHRLHDLVDDLRAIAGPESLGRPFGEGHNLEQAMQCMFVRLESPEDARQCGRIMAVDLISNTQDDRIAEDIMEVMGATPEATQRHQIPAEGRKAVESLAGAAKTFLAQFGGPGNMWDLWSQRDDVAGEFLCWHTVARLRLATAGRMPPVDRP